MLQLPVSGLERAQYRLAGRPPMPPRVVRVRGSAGEERASGFKGLASTPRRALLPSLRLLVTSTSATPLEVEPKILVRVHSLRARESRRARIATRGLVRARALLPLRARTLRGPVAVCRPLSRFPLILTALVDPKRTAREGALQPVSTGEVPGDGATQSILDASAGATLRFRRARKDTEREHQSCGVCGHSHAKPPSAANVGIRPRFRIRMRPAGHRRPWSYPPRARSGQRCLSLAQFSLRRSASVPRSRRAQSLRRSAGPFAPASSRDAKSLAAARHNAAEVPPCARASAPCAVSTACPRSPTA